MLGMDTKGKREEGQCPVVWWTDRWAVLTFTPVWRVGVEGSEERREAELGPVKSVCLGTKSGTKSGPQLKK